MDFVWNTENIDHIARHGIQPDEAEYIVESAKPPYPQMIGQDKRLVVGRLADGRYVQVIYSYNATPSRRNAATQLLHTDAPGRQFPMTRLAVRGA